MDNLRPTCDNELDVALSRWADVKPFKFFA